MKFKNANLNYFERKDMPKVIIKPLHDGQSKPISLTSYFALSI